VFSWTASTRHVAAIVTLASAIGSVSATAEPGLRDFRGMPADISIQSQPLADALRQFSATTGAEVVVDGRAVAGLSSRPVRGVVSPEALLRSMVAGLGLTVRPLEAGSYTLVPDEGGAHEMTADTARFEPYSSRLQAVVMRRLCAARETRPGAYRLALQLWIAPSGGISRSAMLASSGDDVRDAAVAGRLRGPPRSARRF
jgi:hypothetical protein